MAEQFILIPGRSSRQGVTLNEGKYTDGYLDETSTLRMNPDDMQRLGLSTGDDVRMWNEIGEVVVPCLDAKDECPTGLVFICYGDKSSQLMPGETHGSGMPDSKGLDVFVQAASLPREVPTPTPTPESGPVRPATSEPVAVPAAPDTVEQTVSEPIPESEPERAAPTTFGATIALVLLIITLIAMTLAMNPGL